MKPLPILTAVLAIAFAACDKKSDSADSGDQSPGDPGALSDLLLDDAPEGAVSITEARKNPTPGEEIVFSGKIMGKVQPFVEGRALMTVGDPARIVSCDLRPGDDCETPWDVCCDEKHVIAASIVTVQVVDDDGRPLKKGLKGLGGMKELSSLVVKGTVAPGSNPENLLVNATGIHVAMVEPTKENPAKTAQ